MRAHIRSVSISATAFGVVAVLGAPLAFSGEPAGAVVAEPLSARPATAQASESPDLLFVEDFENGVSTTPIMLNRYVGADGGTYTADPAWLNAAECNGIVISANSSNMAACDSNDKLKALGDVLGQITGEDRQSNHVVSAWTSSRSLPANSVQIEALQEFSLGQSGRFVSFGVSAAAGACVGYAHPLLNFLLVDGNVERPVSDRALNPCTDSRSKTYTAAGQSFKGGEYVSSGGVLFAGDTLRWRLRNAQSAYSGNDAAIDRVTIVDSTPTLENEFEGTPIVGDTARMTVRIVNTSEHGAKPGWSLAEQLPDGLTVASAPRVETSCAAPETTVEPGATDIRVKGDLAIDTEDCAVSFDVTATEPGTYTITADDVSDARGLDRPADASVTFTPEQNELGVTERGILTGGNGDDVADLGESISFVTRIENRGNVLVRDLESSGENGATSCDVDSLAPGASATCATSPRIVTQDDIDAGGITDRVDVSAVSRLGQTVRGSASASVSATPSASAAELQITPQPNSRPGVGDEIGLAARVTNSGNVSIRDIAVDAEGFEVECTVPSLAPGASIECDVTGAHVVTQADMDAGSVPFRATVNAVDTAGARVSAEARASQDTVTQAPGVAATVVPELRVDGKAPVAGDAVALTVRVENSGNVTLHDIAASIDDRSELGVVCPEGSLAPGADIECTVPEYVLTQDDVDRGEVVFGASVSAVGPKDQRVEGTDLASVMVDRQHGIVATASAELAGDGAAPKAGDRVELAVTARNSGNTTLRGFAAEVAGRDLDVECADDVTAPGAEVTCAIADHVLTQAEIDAGEVGFEVTVTAAAPGGRTASASDDVSVELARVPAIEMSATSVLDANEHEVPLVGDTATVEMTIRNTGNVTVTGVRGQVADRDGLEVDCPSDELAPGEEVTCVVSEYTLTQGDVDAGGVRFDVTSAATGANRERVEATADTTLTIVRAPAIETTATAELDETAAEHTFAGDTATVRLTIENTGNVTVRDLAGSVEGRDGMVVTCATKSLAPGKSADCTLSKYVLTQGDIDAGKVDFAVTATAVGANGQSVTADAKTGAGIEQAPAVEAVVVAHLAESDSESESEHDAPRAGDRVAVSVRATNTGNVTLTNTRAEVIELADLSAECIAEGVAPGKSIECVVPEYVLTQGDIDHGQVTVAAVLDADGPGGDTVNDRDEVRVGLNAKSVLDVTSEPMVQDSEGDMVVLDGDRALRPGDKVWVRYSVANTGNLVVNAVQHMEDMPAVDVEQAILQPGERTTAMTTDAHTVTEAEAAEGTVVMLGQVKGQVARADGDSTSQGEATTGQTGAESESENTVTALDTETTEPVATTNKPVWVFSTEVRTTVKAEPAPIELAFTGSEITQVVLPAGIVLLLAGAVLLIWIQRRRKDDEQGRHRA